jgi:hypothetical protein
MKYLLSYAKSCTCLVLVLVAYYWCLLYLKFVLNLLAFHTNSERVVTLFAIHFICDSNTTIFLISLTAEGKGLRR